MSWKTKYLESENVRLRKENRELLCAMLDMMGRREAAHLLRGTGAVPAEPTPEQLMDKARTDAKHPQRESGLRETMRGAWRYARHMMEQHSIPATESKESEHVQ